jgi:hypothetical protein
MTSIADYDQLVEGFLTAISALGDDLVTVMLYGSVMRGDVRPGVSDLIDAVVILRPEVLNDEAKFCEVLNIMTETCRPVLESGVPFHAFHYFALDDNRWSTAAVYLPAWTSDKHSKIIAGTDSRHLLATADKQLDFMRGWYFMLHRTIQTNAVLFGAMLEIPEKRRLMIPALRSPIRDLAQFACFACSRPMERAEAVTELSRLFPDVKVNTLKTLLKRFDEPPYEVGIAEGYELLAKIMEIDSTLYEAVIQWIQCHN